MPAALILKKLNFYKNLLYIFYFLSVVSIVCSLSISFVYFYKTGNIEWELFFSLLGIVLFGFILPYLVIKNIKNKIEKLKKQMEVQVQQWVGEWFKTYSQYGNESFKNSEFWLKIVLITLEQMAQFSAHPGIYVAAEVSKVIRLELEKQSK